jgi:hypothetical protein
MRKRITNVSFCVHTLRYRRIVGIARGRPCCVGRVKETEMLQAPVEGRLMRAPVDIAGEHDCKIVTHPLFPLSTTTSRKRKEDVQPFTVA